MINNFQFMFCLWAIQATISRKSRSHFIEFYGSSDVILCECNASIPVSVFFFVTV